MNQPNFITTQTNPSYYAQFFMTNESQNEIRNSRENINQNVLNNQQLTNLETFSNASNNLPNNTKVDSNPNKKKSQNNLNTISSSNQFNTISNQDLTEKMQKFFRKNIKLRNATIKKNFWDRPTINNKSLYFKISENIPVIQFSQGLIQCTKTYLRNDNYEQFLCKVETELNQNNSPKILTFSFIQSNNNIQSNNSNNSLKLSNLNDNLENMLMNPKINDYNVNSYKQNKLKLIENVYKILKQNKKFPKEDSDNFIQNLLVLKRIKKISPNNRPSTPNINTNDDIKCKLYTIFPNINFELKKIKKLSISSKFPLNKLLSSKKTSSIRLNGKEITSGYVSMTNEKRIISLVDDIKDFDLQSSNTLKQILFGIWLSFKTIDINQFENFDEILLKNKFLIFNKLLNFLFISNKIETIFSPSPDEGVFILVIFFKGAQTFYEVKVIPNEEQNTFNDPLCKDLGLFPNSWLIMKRYFHLTDDVCALMNVQDSNTKIQTVSQFLQKILYPDQSTAKKFTSSLTNDNMNNSKNKNNNSSQGNEIQNKYISSGTESNFGRTKSGNLNQKNNLNIIHSSDKNENDFLLKADGEFDPLMEIFDTPFGKNNKGSILSKNSNNNYNNSESKQIMSNLENSDTKGNNFKKISQTPKQQKYDYQLQQNQYNIMGKNLQFDNFEKTNNFTNNSNNINNNLDSHNLNDQNHIFSQSIRNYNNINSQRKCSNLFSEPIVSHKRQNSFQSHQTPQQMGNLLFNNEINNQNNNSKNNNINCTNSNQVSYLIGSPYNNNNFLINDLKQNTQTNNNIITNQCLKKTQMKDEETQTIFSDDNSQSQQSNSQMQGLNNIIIEQTNSIKFLQSKVNELEGLLAKVTLILKDRESRGKCRNKNIENVNNQNFEVNKTNIQNNQKNNIFIQNNTSKSNINLQEEEYQNNNQINHSKQQSQINNKRSQKEMKLSIDENKSNLELSKSKGIEDGGDFEISDDVDDKLSDSLGALGVGNSKNLNSLNVIRNLDSKELVENKIKIPNKKSEEISLEEDEEKEEVLELEESHNKKDKKISLDLSESNAGEKTIEVPQIKFNMTIFSNDNLEL